MNKLFLTLAIVLIGMMGSAQNTLSFISYKSINKSYDGQGFNNEYDSKYEVIFYEDKVTSEDIRIVSDIIPRRITTYHIDYVRINNDKSLSIFMHKSDNGLKSVIHIHYNRLDNKYYYGDELVGSHTNLFKENIDDKLRKYYQNTSESIKKRKK